MSVSFESFVWPEVKRNGKWERVGQVFTNPEHDPEGLTDWKKQLKLSYYLWWYQFRHPLTDVFSSIGMQEGFPIDADYETDPDMQDYYDENYFGKTWSTLEAFLKGLSDFNWDDPFGYNFIFLVQGSYEDALKAKEEAEHDISKGETRVTSITTSFPYQGCHELYAIRWGTYRQAVSAAVGESFWTFVEELKALGDPANVRILHETHEI
ncbi:MAG TPA: hypothetical protein VKF36_19205 [Syntrophorhabdales bacterium]|nr:hypothetical protein [Syntrophorhabdales bacterium]